MAAKKFIWINFINAAIYGTQHRATRRSGSGKNLADKS